MLHEDTYDRYASGELNLQELFNEVDEKVVDEDLFDQLVGIDGVSYTYQGDCSDYYGGYFPCLYKYNLVMDDKKIAEVYHTLRRMSICCK